MARLRASIIVPTSSSSLETGDRTIRTVIRSGVALLDDWLAGVRDEGTHLFTGGPGSGKSSIALHFADAGLRRGERVVMLVNGRGEDIKAHARFLGLNLRTPLEDGRLMLYRYRSDFLRTATHAASAEAVVADFERLIVPHRPSRIVIDSFSPFVSGAVPASLAVAALAELLERSTGCVIATFPEELAGGYDRSVEPLVQSAAAVIRLVREEDPDIRRAELLSLRYSPPGSAVRRFVIREGVGIVAEQNIRNERLTLRTT